MDKAQLKNGLLSIINAYLHDAPLPSCEDFSEVYALAKSHSLTGIFHLATQGKGLLHSELAKRVKEDFEGEVTQQILQQYETDVLFEKFRQENIPFLPLKGYSIRDLYPHPEARVSCDLDVFYKAEDKDKVDKILSEEGFSFVIENATHQEWEKQSVTVEMHYALSGQVPKHDEYYQGVWDRLIVADGSQYAFTKEDEYIYFLVHAAKHFSEGGFGVRTVLDAYLYTTKLQLDRGYLQEELRRLELERFALQIEKLAKAWFGDGKEDAETELIGGFVLSSGVYGSRSNYAVSTSVKSVKKAKFRRLMLSVFPRYRDMKSWYPIVKKVPVSLPFVWVYRWFEILFTRRESFGKVLKDVKEIDEQSMQAVKKIKELTGLSFGE